MSPCVKPYLFNAFSYCDAAINNATPITDALTNPFVRRFLIPCCFCFFIQSSPCAVKINNATSHFYIRIITLYNQLFNGTIVAKSNSLLRKKRIPKNPLTMLYIYADFTILKLVFAVFLFYYTRKLVTCEYNLVQEGK